METVVRLPVPEPANKPRYCETAAYREIYDVLALCRQQGQIGVITGPTGVGKTTACQEFTEKLGVSYMRMPVAANAAQPFLCRLVKAIGRYPQNNAGKHDLYTEIAEHRWRSGALLIIDEGSRLTEELVLVLHALWDEARTWHGHRIGIALVGTPEMTDIWAERRNKRARDPLAPFRARIGQTVALKGPDEADIDALCGHFGLKGKRERDVIARFAKAWDGLHNIDQLMVNARSLAGPGKPIGSEHLFAAAEVMGGR